MTEEYRYEDAGGLLEVSADQDGITIYVESDAHSAANPQWESMTIGLSREQGERLYETLARSFRKENRGPL